MITQQFIERYKMIFPARTDLYPWQVTDSLTTILLSMMPGASSGYRISGDVAIHETAVIEQHVVIKGPAIISPNVFVAANAYLRGPVFLDESVKVGAGCEIKQSIIMSHTAVAHFNYIGNSIVGSRVNFEAGAIAANHFNERENKRIYARINGEMIDTGTDKFGSLVGDDSRIGANAVLSPGTILPRASIVGRLQLIRQYDD